jgi:hypothetical protein
MRGGGHRAFRPCRNIFVRHKKFQSMLRSQFAHEFLINVRGFAAQLVIEVRHAQNDASLLAFFQQQMQKGNGIGASRHGNANALSGRQRCTVLQSPIQVFREIWRFRGLGARRNSAASHVFNNLSAPRILACCKDLQVAP